MRPGDDRGPARALVVVHGVGDQPRDSTVVRLATTIGEALARRGASGISMVHRDDILIKPKEGALQAEPVARFGHYDLRWRSPDGRALRLPLYEFFWADESGITRTLGGQFQAYRQLLTGLPRLGWPALDPGGLTAPRLAKVAGVAYLVAWTELVLRFVGNMVLGLVAPFLRLDSRQFAWCLLPLDLVWAIAGVAAVLSLFAWWAVERSPSKTNRLCTSLIALAVAAIIAEVIPLALDPITGLRPILEPLLGSGTEQSYKYEPQNGFEPRWFRSTNTASGVWLTLTLWLVILCVGRVGVGALGVARRRRQALGRGAGAREADAEAEAGVARLQRKSRRWGVLIALNLLLFAPLVLLFEAGWMTLYPLLPALQTVAEPIPVDLDISTLPGKDQFVYQLTAGIYEALAWLRRTATAVFTLLATLLVVSPAVRERLAPLLELGLDVLNYRSPDPELDQGWVQPKLFGGARGVDRACLADVLHCRLQRLIREVDARHGGPVLVVAHSLGSIIALSALENRDGDVASGWCRRPFATPDPGSDFPRVELITMGSPLEMLARLHPVDFGRWAPGAQPWHLHSVDSWTNLYAVYDAVGRGLDTPAVVGSRQQPLENRSIGAGGHTCYFADPRIGDELAARVEGS